VPPVVGIVVATNPRGGVAVIAAMVVVEAGIEIVVLIITAIDGGRGHSVKRVGASTTRNTMNTMTTTNVEDDLDLTAIDHEVTLLRIVLNHLVVPRGHAIPMETMTRRTWVMQEIANPVVET
jgi:pyruvate/oxaloacetate carboxyltransferase